MARATIPALSPPGAAKATLSWTTGTSDGEQFANDGQVLILVRGNNAAGATAMIMGVSDMHGRGGTILIPASTALSGVAGPFYTSGFNVGEMVNIDTTPAAGGTVLEFVAVRIK